MILRKQIDKFFSYRTDCPFCKRQLHNHISLFTNYGRYEYLLNSDKNHGLLKSSKVYPNSYVKDDFIYKNNISLENDTVYEDEFGKEIVSFVASYLSSTCPDCDEYGFYSEDQNKNPPGLINLDRYIGDKFTITNSPCLGETNIFTNGKKFCFPMKEMDYWIDLMKSGELKIRLDKLILLK